MNIPHDERAHYDAAAQRNREADAPPKPELSDVQRQHMQLLAHQAEQVVKECPELMKWLGDRAWAADMEPTMLKGYLSCLRQIEFTARWEVDNG